MSVIRRTDRRRLMVDGAISRSAEGEVLIQVVSSDGREIGFGEGLAERLRDRQQDVNAGVETAAQMVASSITSLPRPANWRVGEVSASFGVTLTAGAGVLISKVEAGATFEITLTFKPDE
jgi:hypothetical protein